MEPFVELMRRYCIDYTNSHDQSVCDEIMEPEYVVHISGWDLPRDAAYKPAVTRVFARFPGLQLQVHEFVTNGDRLAMRFSEHGAAADAGGRLAAWGGIGLYRWNGRRLLENFVEQDFLAQEEQLATGRPAPLETPHLDPWLATRAEPANAEAEAIVRRWLAKGDLRSAANSVIDGSWYAGHAEPFLDVDSVEVNDLFSAGARVAFHVSQRGRYRGGLAGVDPTLAGREMTLRCVGLARTHAGEVRDLRAISDRLGARQSLLRPAREVTKPGTFILRGDLGDSLHRCRESAGPPGLAPKSPASMNVPVLVTSRAGGADGQATARSSAAMSSFFIFSIASIAFDAFSGSG